MALTLDFTGVSGTATIRDSEGRATILVCALCSDPEAVKALARKVAAVEQLFDALRLEVRNCPMCKGDGVTNQTFAHAMGQLPAGKKVDCFRCAEARQALSIAKDGPQ